MLAAFLTGCAVVASQEMGFDEHADAHENSESGSDDRAVSSPHEPRVRLGCSALVSFPVRSNLVLRATLKQPHTCLHLCRQVHLWRPSREPVAGGPAGGFAGFFRTLNTNDI
jgi:hypothetical protein